MIWSAISSVGEDLFSSQYFESVIHRWCDPVMWPPCWQSTLSMIYKSLRKNKSSVAPNFSQKMTSFGS